MISNTPQLYAFIDESGTNSLTLDKSGTSNLFICVAVVVNDDQLKKAEEATTQISIDHFSGAEIKSSGIGGKHKRRLSILSKLSSMDFGYYALIIDKKKLQRDGGFQYKQSFYKYINKIFYQKIQSGSKMHLFADEVGGKDFMNSFTNYLDEKLHDLFLYESFKHEFADSKSKPLIQLADLIAGTLSYCFDPAKVTDESKVYRDLLTPHEIGISSWPLKKHNIPTSKPQNNDEWNSRIHSFCVNRALEFIEQNQDSSDEGKSMQAAVLNHLLFLKEFDDSARKQTQFALELIQHLVDLGYQELNKQQFSSKVIGPLRSYGVILAGDNEGYQLAVSVRDIGSYLKHNLKVIEPMLSRLQTARSGIKHITANQFDILDDAEFGFLKTIADSFVEHSVKRNISEQTTQGN